MKLLILTLLLTSCAAFKTVDEKPAKKVITKSFTQRKSECVQLFFKLGMKSEEALETCKFIESR